jgi:hypothetical protein
MSAASAVARKKQLRIFVCETSRGTLFVPTQSLWDIHDAAAKAKLGIRKTPLAIRAARRLIESAGAHVPQWLMGDNAMRCYPWFNPWVFEGHSVPKGVAVASRGQISRTSAAWDYVALCGSAGVSISMYSEWFGRGLLPSAEWLQWLFGDNPPSGCYVVPETIQRLRLERSIDAICTAAGVSKKTLQQWNKNETVKRAFEAAIHAASSSGHAGGMAGNTNWTQQSEVSRAAMWRFAKAATISAACSRLHVHFTNYSQALRDAGKAGCADRLEEYLAIGGQGKGYRKCGFVADNFFIPSSGMLRFRRQAAAAATKQNLWALRRMPGFAEWLYDWTVPRAMKGKRHLAPPATNVARLQCAGSRKPIGPQDVIRGAPATRDERNNGQESANRHASAPAITAPPPATTPPKKKRGRPKGVTKDVADRMRKLLEEWDRGDFDSKAQAGRAHGFNRPDASTIINAHEREKAKRKKEQ